MIGLDARIEDTTQRVLDSAKKANFENIRHAAGGVAKTAKESIVTSDEPSRPGTPPHTRGERGHNLRRAIQYAANKDSAVIGPVASMVGQVGAAHEFGETYKGQDFDIRAFMGPALEKNVDRLASEWYGTI